MASKRVMVNLEAGTAAIREAEAAIQNEHVLQNLYETIKSRKGADPSSSWTAKLFSKGRSKISQKVIIPVEPHSNPPWERTETLSCDILSRLVRKELRWS